MKPVYRYFCRRCRRYEYSTEHRNLCSHCGAADLRRDLMPTAAQPQGMRPQSGCGGCGRR